MLGIPVHRVEEGEVGAALGAARLGRLAATGEDPADGLHPSAPARELHARASVAAAYDEAYRRWRELYPAFEGVCPT